MISIMVCPLKELDTSALSVSPRRLTEGVLEGEGPTSADTGLPPVYYLILKPSSDVYAMIFGMVWSSRLA